MSSTAGHRPLLAVKITIMVAATAGCPPGPAQAARQQPSCEQPPGGAGWAAAVRVTDAEILLLRTPRDSNWLELWKIMLNSKFDTSNVSKNSLELNTVCRASGKEFCSRSTIPGIKLWQVLSWPTANPGPIPGSLAGPQMAVDWSWCCQSGENWRRREPTQRSDCAAEASPGRVPASAASPGAAFGAMGVGGLTQHDSRRRLSKII